MSETTKPQQNTFTAEIQPANSEFAAYTYLYVFFFRQHKLKLTNEEMDNIAVQVDKFKQIYDGKKETNTTGDNTPY